MTLEEKELLLKDLCARVPYNTRIDGGVEGYIILDAIWYGIIVANIKSGLEPYLPYLRPMSSMTEEEKREYYKTKDKIAVQWDDYGAPIGYEYTYTIKTYDWLNAHHFDYRGLIEKGLALEAPEDMYNIK